ncbi:helix-turn-helix transcriptional regulator [Nakamurella lactea]|uniref:helix-turn-helix transcriptional regulator n=1 Tax=Nakamurella lactea TaxID=459515 RepID=UPI000688FEEC|nr:helix-turn-helix transcriptional regulator [Nakamurella lactea]
MSVHAGAGEIRRTELATFLRSRRSRITPADAGIEPGPRRKTPGLRREEVALLAGVGVTWYTWLEQGRPINASVQVLDSVARVLQMGPAERWHLYRLADVPGVPAGRAAQSLPDDLPRVLDALDPFAACVYDGKFDMLACNSTYALLFPGLAKATGIERNALWQLFAAMGGNTPLREPLLLPHMVAIARGNYARHLGDPDWEEFISRLSAVSTEFADLWAGHQVAEPAPLKKRFNCPPVGILDMTTASFAVDGSPEYRMISYLPATDADAAKIARLKEIGGVQYPAESEPQG